MFVLPIDPAKTVFLTMFWTGRTGSRAVLKVQRTGSRVQRTGTRVGLKVQRTGSRAVLKVQRTGSRVQRTGSRAVLKVQRTGNRIQRTGIRAVLYELTLPSLRRTQLASSQVPVICSECVILASAALGRPAVLTL